MMDEQDTRPQTSNDNKSRTTIALVLAAVGGLSGLIGGLATIKEKLGLLIPPLAPPPVIKIHDTAFVSLEIESYAAKPASPPERFAVIVIRTTLEKEGEGGLSECTAETINLNGEEIDGERDDRRTERVKYIKDNVIDGLNHMGTMLFPIESGDYKTKRMFFYVSWPIENVPSNLSFGLRCKDSVVSNTESIRIHSLKSITSKK